jgi:hypothetical protein
MTEGPASPTDDSTEGTADDTTTGTGGPRGATTDAAAPAGAAPPTPPPRSAAPTVEVRLFVGWPGPTTPPDRLVLGGAATAGLVAAAAVPLGRPGLGWLVAATAVAVAVGVIARRFHTLAPNPPTGRDHAFDAAWGISAVALAGVTTVRDAPWLVGLCLLAAAAAASISVAGRHVRTLVFAAVAVPVAALRALPWLVHALRRAGRGAGARTVRTVLALLVGLALLAVFGPLLAAADAAFASVLASLLPTIDDEDLARAILFGLGALTVVGAGFLLAAPPEIAAVKQARPPALRRVEWALPIGLLVALFALFVGVQFAAMFGGDDYVQRTAGLTYAEYARSGFWQLAAVTVLALGVVVLATRWAPAPTPADRAWKRSLLATLAALTLVIVASALSRMWLYQEMYGFTVLRVLVLTCELWLGACFLLALVAVLRLRAAPLLRRMAAAGVVALLALAVLDPERFIAEQNAARYATTGVLDAHYLSTLSADAVRALEALPEPARSCVLSAIAARLEGGEDGWRSWNAARTAARDRLAGVPADPYASC